MTEPTTSNIRQVLADAFAIERDRIRRDLGLTESNEDDNKPAMRGFVRRRIERRLESAAGALGGEVAIIEKRIRNDINELTNLVAELETRLAKLEGRT